MVRAQDAEAAGIHGVNRSMAEHIDIRETRPGDAGAIETLYPDAFPDEDLLPVVTALHDEDSGVLSLVALADNAVVGNVIFTMCGVDGRPESAALLAPLAVASDRQGQGVGTAVVHAGLQRLRESGVTYVFVLGDPAYYSRFGFEREDGVAPPYPLPEEWAGAWQSLCLDGSKPDLRGKLSVPEPWRQEALWTQ